ncbi:LRR receptor-like serine/threonine-protein kinase [Carex littledalei]|uniref:LRR receptor-like serine/threonine-protein kinase n=1 Tax=Carex littledalei TaxID=544730 RepID=A0A833VXG5_9POAL|nr:LRR receptor-like serine/threonine-protein kinase [Carex littledalei]
MELSQVVAVNTILGRWGQSADLNWNISGELCSGWAIDSTDLDFNLNFNPGIKCNCTYNSNKTCHIVTLRVYALDVGGTIPDELQNLSYLSNFYIDSSGLSGELPETLSNLINMTKLIIFLSIWVSTSNYISSYFWDILLGVNIKLDSTFFHSYEHKRDYQTTSNCLLCSVYELELFVLRIATSHFRHDC